MTPASDQGSIRNQSAIYALAFFHGNLSSIVSVIMPLWALSLEASPVFIGLIIASRQVLSVGFSIHSGALLDRFDPRAVIVTLGLSGALLSLLYPVLPFVWAAIAIQMLAGFAETTNWIGTQSLVGRLLRGHAVYAGRMTAAARLGGFAAPVLAGLAWQLFGPLGAFIFVCAWIGIGILPIILLPPMPPVPTPEEAPASNPGQSRPTPPPKSRARNVLPKISDYTTTFRLLLLPTVALVIAATFLRQTGSGIQTSFYGVWLTEAGYTASLIGLLIGVGNIVSAAAALGIGPLIGRFNEHRLLMVMIFLGVAGIAITPLLDAIALLFIAISLRGIGQGLNLPLMMSIASRAVGQDLQGRVAALRISFNRLGSLLVPLVMGMVAEFFGLEAAFYVVGLFGVGFIGILAIWVSRQPSPAGD